MVENGEKMVKFYFFFLKNGEMVKNGDLNFKIFSHKIFISSLEYISMIVYTNVKNHLFSSLVITLLILNSSFNFLIFILHLWFPLKSTFYLEISRFTFTISGTVSPVRR